MYFLNSIYSVDMHRRKVKPIKRWDKTQRCFRKLFQMFQMRQAHISCCFFFFFWCIYFHRHLFRSSASFSLTRGVLTTWIRSPVPLTGCLLLCCAACVITALLKLLTLNFLLKTSLKERSPYAPDCAPRLSYDSTVRANSRGAWDKI